MRYTQNQNDGPQVYIAYIHSLAGAHSTERKKKKKKEKKNLRRKAFQPCREAWLMGGLGWTEGVPSPSKRGERVGLRGGPYGGSFLRLKRVLLLLVGQRSSLLLSLTIV